MLKTLILSFYFLKKPLPFEIKIYYKKHNKLQGHFPTSLLSIQNSLHYIFRFQNSMPPYQFFKEYNQTIELSKLDFLEDLKFINNQMESKLSDLELQELDPQKAFNPEIATILRKLIKKSNLNEDYNRKNIRVIGLFMSLA